MTADEVTVQWGQVERWLADHAPADFATLQAGSSGQEMARLEEGLGFHIHRNLRSFLGVCGGCLFPVSSMDAGAFFFGYALLDVDGILATHHELVDMVEEAVAQGYADSVVGSIADRFWVPIARDVTGDIMFVDHRPGREGNVCAMSFGDPESIFLWPSMALMLDDMLTALRSGTSLAAFQDLTPRVHEEKMVQWEIRI
ncbi:SMI1/KNR4 family protein [Streptomyces andamanensis]|uniref:SMI1/KNR4 family protein n=1 Tax=Streptomyces andamanensis TaxID=1565035 RepID=A0ABV8TLH6_9ACTN